MTTKMVEEYLELGTNRKRGNLLGIQPWMTAHDYTTGRAFSGKMMVYFKAAAEKGWLGDGTIAVLPEYLGTWLAAVDEKGEVYQADTIEQAMKSIALASPLAFGRTLFKSKEKDRTAAAIFRMKAARMAEIYQRTFSALAREYAITIVAGSILLTNPTVTQGNLTAGAGPIYNVSAVFKPDGSLYPNLSKKIYPINDEQPFVAAARVMELPVFDTPAGRLGVLVCADSWYPAVYRRLKEEQVELIAVPSYAAGKGLWEQPWQGYNGASAPADVDPQDAGKITEGQAWEKYALSGRMESAGARYGVNVFLRGELWNLGTDGYSRIVCEGETAQSTSEKAALLNLWL